MTRRMSPTPGTPEWVELRRSGIGATDAAVVCGRSPFRTPFEKYAEMLGRTAPLIETEAMEWGIRLQPVVGAAWAEKYGRRVRACRWVYVLEPGIFSSYDFEVVPPKGEPVTELVETKTTSVFNQREWGEPGTDQAPTAYLLQCQHQMACRPGIVRVHLVVLVGGQKLRQFIVERDDELIGYLLTIERKFLADTAAGIPPEMDGSEAASAFLRAQFPGDDGTVVELDADTTDVAREYLAAKAAEKDALGRIALLGNVLRDRLKAAAVATSPEIKVTYKQSRPSQVFDWRTATEHLLTAEQIAHYTTEKPGARPLVVSWIGE